MTMYRVTWEIDIDADDPRKAAKKALEIQRRDDSIATVFDVQAHGGRRVTRVDLTMGDDMPHREPREPIQRYTMNTRGARYGKAK